MRKPPETTESTKPAESTEKLFDDSEISEPTKKLFADADVKILLSRPCSRQAT
jgi:hypothetical protein